MQIVRDLAGYTYGGSDVLRRAMSKKKTKVMEEERQNFVYGNAEKGIPGCISRGISEQTANHIYDEMLDFAKYAFNKSHAAAYAIVSFQTAWLKYYHPVAFMAALMTSCIDNPGKVAEYILHCRALGIGILPPDINRSRGTFSVEDGKIRYALTAVKGIGRPVMQAIENERDLGGPFQSLQDFCRRLDSREVNKRTLESFIKAGAFDTLGGTRRQFLQVYTLVMDQTAMERKSSLTGQMNLFDFMGEEDRKALEIRLPDVGEFSMEEKLAFEKEVTGIYISGHPLQDYEARWRKGVTNVSTDFQPDEETGYPRVQDRQRAVIGGMITEKTIKYTKNSQAMAFLTLEDLVGTTEVIVFPKSLERCASMLEEDARVFIEGRVSVEEDRPAKLIMEQIWSFSDASAELWLQFADRAAYEKLAAETERLLPRDGGNDRAVIYLRAEKAIKKLPGGFSLMQDRGLQGRMEALLGKDNVRVVEKGIEKRRKML